MLKGLYRGQTQVLETITGCTGCINSPAESQNIVITGGVQGV